MSQEVEVRWKRKRKKIDNGRRGKKGKGKEVLGFNGGSPGGACDAPHQTSSQGKSAAAFRARHVRGRLRDRIPQAGGPGRRWSGASE